MTNGPSHEKRPAGHYNLGELNRAIKECTHLGQVRLPKKYMGGPHVIQRDSYKAMEGLPKYPEFNLEGRPEGNATLLFEFDPEILYYKPQPFTLHYHFQGRQRHYTPDFLLFHRLDECSLCEIKPKAKFDEPENYDRYLFIERQALRQGVEFRRLTAQEIDLKPRLNNLIYLYPFAAPETAYALPQLVSSLAHAGRPLHLQTLQRMCADIGATEIAVGLKRGLITASHRFPWGPLFQVCKVG